MAHRIRLRRDTEAKWASVNPTLTSGELGIETDTLRMKIGDGVSPWNALGYLLIDWNHIYGRPTTVSGYGITDAYTMSQVDSEISVAIANLINGAPSTLDTLNEIAASLNNNDSAVNDLLATISLKVAQTDYDSDISVINTTLSSLSPYDQDLNTSDDVTFNTVTTPNLVLDNTVTTRNEVMFAGGTHAIGMSSDDYIYLNGNGILTGSLSINGEALDSAWVQARQVDVYRDSAFVTGIVDSSYITGIAYDQSLNTTDSVQFAGLSFGDNQIATFGAANDLQIYHNGTENIIRGIGSQGEITIQSIGLKIVDNGNVTVADFAVDGSRTVLYYQGNETLAVESDGVNITGDITVSGNTNISGDITISGSTNITGNLSLGDNEKVTLGDGNDLQIYHNGTENIILGSGVNGTVKIQSSGIRIADNGNQTRADFGVSGDEVRLFYQGNEKLATKTDGVDTTGDGTITGNLAVAGFTNFTGTTYHNDGILTSSLSINGEALDSAWVQARQTTGGGTGLDSASTISLIDSAYIQARQSSTTPGSAGLDSAGLEDYLNGKIGTHLIPAANSQYDLGEPENKFRDLYLSSATMYIGDTKVSMDSSGNFVHTNPFVGGEGFGGVSSISFNKGGNGKIEFNFYDPDPVTATWLEKVKNISKGDTLINVTGTTPNPPTELTITSSYTYSVDPYDTHTYAFTTDANFNGDSGFIWTFEHRAAPLTRSSLTADVADIVDSAFIATKIDQTTVIDKVDIEFLDGINPAEWDGLPPTTVMEAINRIVTKLNVLNGGPI